MTSLFTAYDQVSIFFSAIEKDLRRVTAECFTYENCLEFIPDDLRKTAGQRRRKDIDHPSEGTENDYVLLEYLNLGDLCQIINSHKPLFDNQKLDALPQICIELITFVPLRNRVAHSRELNYDDYPQFKQFVEQLLEESRIRWTELADAWGRIKIGDLLVKATHRTPAWLDDGDAIPNNLPTSDYLETGWVGRKRDVDSVKKLLLGPYPVISIIGEGGIGKTAIALRVVRDILEDAQYKSIKSFDIIIWLSLKSAVFSANGIRTIANSIADTATLFARLAEKLGVLETCETPDALVIALQQYLKEFRTLLVIDNLETISSDGVRDFLGSIPVGTKVLITTRVSLGQSERAYALGPFEERESVHLFRAYADALGSSFAISLKTESIKNYCVRLSNNPLAIKWFVGSIANGKDPAALIARQSDDFRKLLSFAFTDLFHSFDSTSRLIVEIIYASSRELSRAEITWLVEVVDDTIPVTTVDTSIRLLITSSVLRSPISRGTQVIQKLELGAFAKQYLSELSRPSQEFIKLISESLKDIRAAYAEGSRSEQYDRWDFRNVVDATTVEEQLVKPRVLAALRTLYGRQRDDDLADECLATLARAERILPGYSEILRVRGLAYGKKKDFSAARESYEQCLEVDPSNRLGRFVFALALIHEHEDYDRAIPICKALTEEFPNEIAPLSLYALACQRSGSLEKSRSLYDRGIELIEQLQRSEDNGARQRQITICLNQAAETYRRISEQDITAKNYKSFTENICAAIQISGIAYNRMGVTPDYRDQQLKNLREAFFGIRRSRDSNMAARVCQIFLEIDDVFDLSTIPMSPNELRDICTADAAIKMCEFLAEKVITEDSLKGYIMSVNTKQRFGFIKGASGERYYFNFRQLASDIVDRETMLNSSVTFELGSNPQGPCAVNVHLVNPSN